MNRRFLKVVGAVAVLLLVFLLGAAAGGGAVFAITRGLHVPPVGTIVSFRAAPRPGVVIRPPRASVLMALPSGALITEVAPDSPAAQASLEAGELIVAVDGQELESGASLSDLVGKHQPGDTLTLEVMRPGQDSREVSVKLGEHPEKEGAAYLGIQYVPAPQIKPFEGELRPFLREPDSVPPPLYLVPGGGVEQGAAVVRVAEDSPAAAAELQRGDIITAVDGEAIASPQALVETIAQHKPGDKLTLSVYRPADDETLEVEVTLVEHPGREGRAYLGVVTANLWRLERRERAF